MNLTSRFTYHYLFGEPRPNRSDLLKDIPSKYVIVVLSFINNVLQQKGDVPKTQFYLFDSLTKHIDSTIKNELLNKISSKIQSNQYVLFEYPTTVEFVNRELINYRDGSLEITIELSIAELNILKAYVALIDETNERDVHNNQKEVEKAKLNEEGVKKLMWPHLIRQLEFVNRADAIYELLKGKALLIFLENHPKYSQPTIKYFQNIGYQSGLDYLNRLEFLLSKSLVQKPSADPNDFNFIIGTEDHQHFLEYLSLDQEEISSNTDKQIGYSGLKEKPIFKLFSNGYIVPFWDYLYNALFIGLISSVYNNSEINLVDKNFGDFKSTLGKEFSEQILFRKLMQKSFTRMHECLLFFDDDKNTFTPDCYYRRKNDIFIIEFKDNILKGSVIQSGSYEKIRESIYEKFVEAQNGDKLKKKGILQLRRNIKLLENNEDLFHSIDKDAKSKKLKLRNMTIYPIIVHANNYFDLPGLNNYLEEILCNDINNGQNNFRLIKPITVVNLYYFYKRIQLFSYSKIQLSDELDFYHETIKGNREKWKKSENINDWFNSLSPFGNNSPAVIENATHKLGEFMREISSCWGIA